MRIIDITDTRETEETPEGRFRPIPGSGDARPCDRCGRLHEVHVTVETDDGQRLTVGSTCALTDDERRAFARALRSLKRVADLEADVARREAAIAKIDEIRLEVAALEIPEITVVDRSGESNGQRFEIHCGDARVWGANLTDERRQCVIDAWQKRRFNERLNGLDMTLASKSWLAEKRCSLDKAQKHHASILAAML